MTTLPLTIRLPKTVNTGEANIPLALSVTNLGFIVIADITLDKQDAAIGQSACSEHCKISAINNFCERQKTAMS